MNTELTLVERVVVGGKNYSWVDYEAPEGENPRKIAKPGDTITVTVQQAQAFSHRLVDPNVAEAQANAAVAIAEADAAVQASLAEAAGVSVDDDDVDEED